MTMKNHAMKNAPLVKELAMYLAKHPDAEKKRYKNATYIAFSAKDAELNKENEKMIASFVEEGKTVIRAVQTNNTTRPWEFFPVFR